MNVFNLAASLTLDKKNYEDGLNAAENQATKSGSKIGGIFKALGTATVAGLGASTVAVGKLLKDSVAAYAEYEQLVGGVQKLYGTAGMSVEQYAKSVGKSVDEVQGKYDELNKAQDLVMKNAADAYRTAGMSASQYMDQATSLSASLINSLEGDTVKAAKQTDVAMRAIADNYNTFGGDMQMIQGAFQGFAKQNYTMLDNLKLGYGGTKTEMERLIADANEWAAANGKAADLSIDSFSDVVTAIDYIQQKQQIAGTTAREASTTISGSLGMLKAAWENLVTGFSDPKADISKLVENVMSSLIGYTDEAGKRVNGFLDNLMPAVEQALKGIGTAITKFAPVITSDLPKLIASILPEVLSSAAQLFAAVIGTIPTLVADLVSQLVTAFADHRGDFVQGVQMIYDSIIEFINEATSNTGSVLTPFIQTVLSIIDIIATTAWEHLPDLIAAATNILVEITSWISEHLGDFTVVAIEILTSMANGLIESIPIILDAIPKVIESLLNAILDYGPQLLEMGIYLIETLALGLLQNLPKIIETSAKILQMIPKTIIEHLPEIVATGIRIVAQLGIGLIKALPSIIQAAGSLIKALFTAWQGADWISIGKNVIKGIVRGLKDAGHMIKDFLLDLMKGAVDGVKKFFGIHSPSRKMRKEVGFQVGAGMALGIEDSEPLVTNAMSELHQIPEDFDPSDVSSGSPRSAGGGSTYIINVNQPVSTPDEMANAIRVESQYGLIEGVPI